MTKNKKIDPVEYERLARLGFTVRQISDVLNVTPYAIYSRIKYGTLPDIVMKRRKLGEPLQHKSLPKNPSKHVTASSRLSVSPKSIEAYEKKRPRS